MKFSLLSATALAGSLALATGAFAQTTANDSAPKVGPSGSVIASADDAADSGAQIIVTGTRIRRPNLESTVPITAISGEEFFQTGSVSVGDTLNDLPQLRNTYSQQNSTRNLGNRGLNIVDLRGLGTARTLVLVNGRRHVGSDVLLNAVSPDINTFPTDLIERVDIITGGNSSIYGSDAIAGVLNFVLKDHYEGIQVRAQNGISQYGDAGNRYVSGLYGKNFADGRGNIALNIEYTKTDRYFASNRPNVRQNDAFVVVDTDPAGAVNGSDGVFDRYFFRDLRSTTISTGGQIGFTNTAGACGRDSTGAAFTCGYLFQPDGSLIPQTGTRIGLAPNGNYLGGNGYSGREGELITLTPSLKKYSANLIGHFEISPAFVPFIEAKYVRSDAFGSQSGPFFSQGTTLGGDVRERPLVDNPYLTAQARAVIIQQLAAGGVVANTTTRFSLRKNFVDLGIRDERLRRETYRAVVGLKGDFNTDWNYELSLNYGEHRERNVIQSNINRQRYLLAIDAVRDASGNIVCRSKVTPASAGTDIGTPVNPAILAADVAACVPLNPFGDGNISQAAKNYVTMPTIATGRIKQFVASGFVAGDLSSLFELPGGPIGFSVGAEYRRERVNYDLDDLTQAGYAFYNAIPSFTAPAFEVKEAFAEVSVPLLKDFFLAKELTLTGSGRVSDYKGNTGTVYTYAGGVDWRPIQDIHFRGAYSRAIRAPNLSELYSAQGQNFAPAPNDPCSARNLATGSATRAANCSAAGRPAAYDFVYTSSLEIVSGGNPNLREEKSTSYTGGVVLQPRFVPGLSLSVDYYNISVKNVITSVTAQNIINNCYDAATLANPFCALFQRAGAAGGPRGEQAFRILEGSLLQSQLNFAKLTARGVDTELAYRRRFSWGSAGFQTVWTRVLERNDFTNAADPARANRILSELGDPKNQVNFNGDVTFGKITVGYKLRWIDKMFLNTAEDYISIQGRPPENTDYADLKYYPDVFYHAVRIGVDITDKFNIYGGVENLGNRKPPFGLTGVGAGSGIYDVRGRYGYIGISAKL